MHEAIEIGDDELIMENTVFADSLLMSVHFVQGAFQIIFKSVLFNLREVLSASNLLRGSNNSLLVDVILNADNLVDNADTRSGADNAVFSLGFDLVTNLGNIDLSHVGFDGGGRDGVSLGIDSFS